MTDGSGYVLETLREGGEFTLYRGRQDGNPLPVLAVALTAEQPSSQSLRQLEHEYSVAAELDSAWAARPLELTRRDGRTMLILEDPGGEPLDRILERCDGQRLELTRVVRIAIGLATALGHVHGQGLIHKDIKPAPTTSGSRALGSRPGFRASRKRPRRRRSLPGPWPTWRPNKPAG